MTMQKKNTRRFCWYHLLFIVAILFTCVVSYFVTRDCIDSDASSELILAEHLSKTGGILSADWCYSTEIRVLNTQLVYTPLFLLFNSWHLVRYFGALILQGILVLAIYLFTRLLKMEKKVFFITAAFSLLPLSVCYGRIVLYHCYYVPHIALSLIMTGLVFGTYTVKWKRIVALSLLSLLSFAGGLGGIRQLMITHAPLLLAVLCLCFLTKHSTGRHLHLFFMATISAAFSTVGFLVNKFYLAQLYTFQDKSENVIHLLDADYFSNVAYGFFHHFGFRDEVDLISVAGIFGVLGLFLGLGCIGIACYYLWRYRRTGDLQQTIPYVMFLAYVVVMLFVFWITGDVYRYVLYWTPVTAWMLPVFVLQLGKVSKPCSPLQIRKILPYGIVLVLVCNGLMNATFLLNTNYFTQKYEGLGFQEKDWKAQMTPVVSFLQGNGYTLGYATFWNCNIITEVTDGEIRMIYTSLTENTDWLTLKSNRSLTNQQEFLLLQRSEVSAYTHRYDLTDDAIVYQDEVFVVYGLE